MRVFQRLFPRKEVRTALESIAQLERSLPGPLGPQLGFEVIKRALRQESIQKPEELHKAIQITGYSIEVLVFLCARNIIWDELQSGRYQTIGTRKTMTGDGLVALYHHLTSLLEEKGVETREEARASRASLRDMIQTSFGFEIKEPAPVPPELKEILSEIRSVLDDDREP